MSDIKPGDRVNVRFTIEIRETNLKVRDEGRGRLSVMTDIGVVYLDELKPGEVEIYTPVNNPKM